MLSLRFGSLVVKTAQVKEGQVQSSPLVGCTLGHTGAGYDLDTGTRNNFDFQTFNFLIFKFWILNFVLLSADTPDNSDYG